MSKAMKMILLIILLINMANLAWAGTSHDGLFLQISMGFTIFYMVGLIVSSCYLIVKNFVTERKERSTSRLHDRHTEGQNTFIVASEKT